MVYFWWETHLEIQHKFHWAEVWDDRAHKEVHVTTSNTYVLSSQSSLTGDKKAPDFGDEQLSGVSPEEVARAAVERASRNREAVIVTASHWPTEAIGSQNRLSAVKVCPDDSLNDVAEKIGKFG